MSTDETEQAPPAIILDFDFDAGDLEDIEEYTGINNAFAMLSEAVEGIPPGKQVQTLAAKLPAKMVTAVLGAARRRTDPSWTMDRWRGFRFTDLRGIREEEPETAPGPTKAASSPRSMAVASQNGSPKNAPEPISDTTG